MVGGASSLILALTLSSSPQSTSALSSRYCAQAICFWLTHGGLVIQHRHQHCQQSVDLQQTLPDIVACSVCHQNRCHYCQFQQDHRRNHQAPLLLIMLMLTMWRLLPQVVVDKGNLTISGLGTLDPLNATSTTLKFDCLKWQNFCKDLEHCGCNRTVVLHINDE